MSQLTQDIGDDIEHKYSPNRVIIIIHFSTLLSQLPLDQRKTLSYTYSLYVLKHFYEM